MFLVLTRCARGGEKSVGTFKRPSGCYGANVRVVVAANGREALQVLDKESFDLVLMDIQMPEMDGLAATAALRKKEKEKGNGRRQSVVALTAHAMKGDYERCMVAGMDGYLTKPIRPQELDEILEKCLAQRV